MALNDMLHKVWKLKDEATKNINFTKDYVHNVNGLDVVYRVEVVEGCITIFNKRANRKVNNWHHLISGLTTKVLGEIREMKNDAVLYQEIDNTDTIDSVQKKCEAVDELITKYLEKKKELDRLLMMAKETKFVGELLDIEEKSNKIF